MILIVSDGADPHVRVVTQRLREKGAEVQRFDVRELPRDAGVGVRLDDEMRARVRITRRSGALDLARADAVWFRRLAPVATHEDLSEEDAAFAEREATAFAYSIGAMLDDRFCVNPLVAAMATDRGRGKVSQLEAARRLGISIPRTLATNAPEAAREFLQGLTGAAIYKPLFPPTRQLAPPGEKKRWASVFTNKLDERALAKLDGVRYAPCIFQELVDKRLELRVTVIGERVFATEIHSQVHADSSVDFRRRFALGETPYAVHDLPAAVADQCRALNRALGLRFGAQDFILTPDGRYVFLEVNQAGQFLWLEEQTGQPLLESFCELLMQCRDDYECDAQTHAPGPMPEAPPTDELDILPEELRGQL
jgi:glutathione synthase/RimK-type ligase-like ATP-grasp enzyme